MKDARSASLSGPFGCRTVLRFDRPSGRRVLRFDSGLWPLRVVVAADAAVNSRLAAAALPTAAKTFTTGLRPLEMHPYSPTGTSPGGGSLLYA